MRSDLFQSETIGVANTLGRTKQHVEVVFEGAAAKTDGSIITLPSLPPAADLDDETVGVFRGYVDHESLHQRYTDTTLDTSKLSKMAQALLNGIEDVRIETVGVNDYPGMRRNLEITTNAVNHDTLEFINDTLAGQELTFEQFGPTAITWEGRRRIGQGTASQEALLAKLPDKMRKRVERIADLVEKCKSTADAMELALLIENGKDEEEPKGDSGDGDGGDGDQDGGGDSGDTGGQPRQAGDQAQAGQQQAPYDPSANDTLNRLAGKYQQDIGKGYWTPTTRFDKLMVPNFRIGREDHDTEHHLRQMLGPHANTLRRKLERLVMAKDTTGWHSGQRHGRLDTSRLVPASLGNRNVHRERWEEPEVNASALLLIDLSGSMRNERIKLATMSAMAIGETLERIGSRVCVAYFTTSTNRDSIDTMCKLAKDMSGSDTKKLNRARKRPVITRLAKEFDETMRSARGRFGRIVRDEDLQGYTPTGEGIAMVLPLLMREKSDIKLLFLFTDGQPQNASQDQEVVYEYAKKIIASIPPAITLVPVGIGLDIRHLAPGAHTVGDASDLAKIGFNELLSKMVRRRAA